MEIEDGEDAGLILGAGEGDKSNGSGKDKSNRSVRHKSGESYCEVDDDSDDDNDEGAKNGGGRGGGGGDFQRKGKYIFNFDTVDDTGFLKLVSLDNPKDKESDAYSVEPAEVRDQCLKTVVRLFLTKGAQGEPVSKTAVRDALGKIDADYKKHATCVILAASSELRTFFGYRVTVGKTLGVDKGKKEDLYLVNINQSAALQEILAELNPSDAYMGFVFIVLQILNTAPGKKMDGDGVLKNIRRIDDRFPDSVKTSKADGAAVPELGDSFAGLMARMQKEKYVIVAKDEGPKGAAAEDGVKKIYELGPRFYAEFGLRRLAKTYYGQFWLF